MSAPVRGRPRIKIDWVEFDKLCSIHCTLNEIAGWFNCSPDTIEAAVKRDKGELFSEYFKKKSAGGKISLRRKWFSEALNGNTTMLVIAIKQLLGYHDKQVIESNQTVTTTPEKFEPRKVLEQIKKDPFMMYELRKEILSNADSTANAATATGPAGLADHSKKAGEPSQGNGNGNDHASSTARRFNGSGQTPS